MNEATNSELIFKLSKEVERLKERVAMLENQVAAGSSSKPLPAEKGSNALRLITLARTDPEAAKAEARRLAREDTFVKRTEKLKGGSYGTD